MTLWTNEQADIVDARVLRDVQLLLDLALILQRVQNGRIQVAHVVLVGVRHELLIEVVALLVLNRKARILLLLDFLLSGIAPLVSVSSLAWRLSREVDVFLICRDAGERIERSVRILHDLSRLLQLLKVQQATSVAEALESLLIPVLFLIFGLLAFNALLLLHLHARYAWCITKSRQRQRRYRSRSVHKGVVRNGRCFGRRRTSRRFITILRSALTV